MASRSQTRQALIQRRAADAVVNDYSRRVSREIARTTRAAAVYHERGDTLAMGVLESKHAERLTPLLTALWSAAGESMAAAMPRMKSFARHEVKEFFTAPNAAMAAAQYASVFGGHRITQIARTTLFDVQQGIAEAIASGRDERETARLIRAFAPIKAASRAQTIARTETGAASAYVAQSIAELAGVDMDRVWVSSAGERTRDAHADVDGQRRGMYEPFNVDDESLMYPCDPQGSAKNVINCRCQVVYEPR